MIAKIVLRRGANGKFSIWIYQRAICVSFYRTDVWSL